jgi:ATP-dependent DNA helicase RecG
VIGLQFDEAIGAILAGGSAASLESPTLEFKQDANNIRENLKILSDAVVCLANGDGGTIIVGVHDKLEGPPALLGVSDSLNTRTVIKGIFERTKPSLSVSVVEHEKGGLRFLEITVPRGATIYSNSQGTATRRVGDQCAPFTPAEQREALVARGFLDWSAGATKTKNFSIEQVARVRTRLKEMGRLDLANQDDIRLLSDLRLTTVNGYLNRAGLLLVGEEADIALEIPNYGYFFQFRPNPGSEATARTRGRRPIIPAIEQLLDQVEARNSIRPLKLNGGIQATLHDYPHDAVREIIVNAFVHRDYEIPGSVDVEQSPEALRISSPGDLVYGVTPENILTHPSTPRNTLLLETVTLLQLAERSGQGVDRAYRAMLRNGKEPPTYFSAGSRVDVEIMGGIGKADFAKYVANGLPSELANDIETLLTLDYLCLHRRISANALAPIIQRSWARAQQSLARISNFGLIEPSKRTARNDTPNYSLTATAVEALGHAVVYHQNDTKVRDAKITDHLKEYAFVTNQTVRRMFDVDTIQARNILADLQRRGVILKQNPAARGPGVRYVLSDAND